MITFLRVGDLAISFDINLKPVLPQGPNRSLPHMLRTPRSIDVYCSHKDLERFHLKSLEVDHRKLWPWDLLIWSHVSVRTHSCIWFWVRSLLRNTNLMEPMAEDDFDFLETWTPKMHHNIYKIYLFLISMSLVMLAPQQSVARYDLAWYSHHHSSTWVSFAKERHRGVDAALHSVIEDPSEVPAPSEVETATTVALGSVFDATFEDVTKMIESFLEVCLVQ